MNIVNFNHFPPGDIGGDIIVDDNIGDDIIVDDTIGDDIIVVTTLLVMTILVGEGLLVKTCNRPLFEPALQMTPLRASENCEQ